MKFSTLVIITLVIGLFSCSQKPKSNKELAESVTDTAILRQQTDSSISIKGKLLEEHRWKDNIGYNLLIISRYRPPTETYQDSPGLTTESAFLYINHYVKDGAVYKLIWSKSDSVIRCPTDYWIGTLEKSTSITDLDQNGISEITIIYSHACRGDISPSNMDLIIAEGNKSFNLKGQSYLEELGGKLNKDSFETNLQKLNSIKTMGRYKNEDDFLSAPQVFLEYARSKWIECIDKDNFKQLNGTKD
jgi:hypothetical protein